MIGTSLSRKSNASLMSNQTSVTEMFDGIAENYDRLNHLLSFGIDRFWRRRTSKCISHLHPSTILDVATGTADLAIQLAHDNPDAIISGVDLSKEMLNIGNQKVNNRKLSHRIHLEIADAAALPFADGSFDVVTVAFGVRNFGDREAGLREMVRVCREDGMVAVLEFSHPTNALVRAPYRWYSRQWIPRIGQKVSKHSTAYNYLPSSVEAFPPTETFIAMLEQAGLRDLQTKAFNGGIATLYYGYALKNPESSQ